MKILPAFICVFACLMCATLSGITGTAFFSNQTNHTGIKVKFSAISGTAATDSCLTNSAGAFSLNIPGGTYKVQYSSPGYGTMVLNNYSTVVLTNTTVLQSTTLSPGSNLYVSGFVSGNWTSNHVYYVTDNITVAANSTLNIAAGTLVKFLGNFDFLINGGQLNATGTSNSRITFTSDNSTKWEAISIYSSPSVFNNCIFEKCVDAIRAFNSSIIVTDCIFRELGTAVYTQSGAALITRNEMYNFGSFGVWSEGSSTGTISCNHIENSGSNPAGSCGIRTNADNLIEKNHIHHVQNIFRVGNSSQALIRNNYLHDGQNGINIGNTISSAPDPIIHNNTFSNITFFLTRYSFASVRLYNNIVMNSSVAVAFDPNLTCDHNLFYNCAQNFINSSLPGIGQVVGNNSNGDPIDSYFNVFADPDFVPNQEPFLQSSSAALNAGNTTYGNNIGCNSSVVCFNSLLMGIQRPVANVLAIELFPNPTAGKFTLRVDCPSQVEILDLSGKVVFGDNHPAGALLIDISSFDKGLYLIKVVDENHSRSARLIKE